jgi:ATP-binding cassette subfamily C protein
MRLLLTLLRAYPWRTAFALVSILFAGIADGVSISALLPLLNLVTRGNYGEGAAILHASQAGTRVEEIILTGLSYLGLEATLGVLLVLVVLAVLVKSMLLLLANNHVGYSAAHITTDLRLDLLRAVLATSWGISHQPIGSSPAPAAEANRAAQSYIFGVTMLAMLFQALVYIALPGRLLEGDADPLGVGLAILSVSHLLVRMSACR